MNKVTKHIRRRYIAVMITSEYPVNERDFFDSLWDSITTLYGEYGASQANIRYMSFDAETNQAILRCSHKALDQVKASLIAITEIGRKKASVHIQRVSGTLKAICRKTLKS